MVRVQYKIVHKDAVPLWISADGSILVQTFLNWSLQKGLNFIPYLYYTVPDKSYGFLADLLIDGHV